jgi:hypothetical protein
MLILSPKTPPPVPMRSGLFMPSICLLSQRFFRRVCSYDLAFDTLSFLCHLCLWISSFGGVWRFAYFARIAHFFSQRFFQRQPSPQPSVLSPQSSVLSPQSSVTSVSRVSLVSLVSLSENSKPFQTRNCLTCFTFFRLSFQRLPTKFLCSLRCLLLK